MKNFINSPVGIGIVVIFIVGVFYGSNKLSDAFLSDPPTPQSQWQKSYREALLNNGIDLKYTQAQSTIDYVTPELQEVIGDMDASSPKDALKKTTKFVLNNIQYSSAGITANFCFRETATSVYKLGLGDCVSMTKLGMAILRGQGIAVRSVGGCLLLTGDCAPIMGVVPMAIFKEEVFDGKKRGYLHEWAEVYMPNEGWVTVDFTNGAIYNEGCNDYIFYSYDGANYRDMCIITDSTFNNMCWSS